MSVQYRFPCAPKLARKCEIEDWCACGAEGRSVGRTVTLLPNFLGWVDYHISLPMGLRPRAFRSRVELRYKTQILLRIVRTNDLRVFERSLI